MTKIKVAMLVFEGFELLDVFGPLQMLSVLGERSEVLVTAENAGLVKSIAGMRVEATVALADLPPVDVLLIPGGRGTREVVKQPALMALIADLVDRTPTVASICTGAGILAATGALEGLRATTNKLAFDWPRSQGPKTKWIPQARWVEDGKFITSAGVSAGMDMTLALIEKWFGRAEAESVALDAEYDWHQDPNWDPFAPKAGLV